MSCSIGMRRCGPLCGHRCIVDAYRQERQRLETVAENVSLGYAAEYADHVRQSPLPTFKQWLIQSRRI